MEHSSRGIHSIIRPIQRVKDKITIVNLQELVGRVAKLLTPGLVATPRELDTFSKKMAFEIYPKNFGRAMVLADFIEQISGIFEPTSKIRVAVIGGYLDEPELLALEKLQYSTEVTIFGIESDMNYLNMNEISEIAHGGRFDLILCSQVWEHIWNHGNAFKNLLSIMHSGSYLWLASPTSNRAHASPDYFSAGFTASYLSKNLEYLGLKVISSGQLGTARNYRATHTMPEWLTVNSHRLPLLNTFRGNKLIKRIVLTSRYFLRSVELQLFSGKITAEDSFATESWILAQKP